MQHRNLFINFILKLNNKKILFLAVMIGFFFTLGFCVWGKNYSDNIQKNISNKIFRLHVLANSNSIEDQKLKLKVRDEVLSLLKNKLYNIKSKDETKKILLSNLAQINSCAQDIVFKNGFDYKTQAFICKDDFPTKQYGDLKFPAGNYEALKIIIGTGKGKNFWCAMFPPLCFVDLSKKTMPNYIKKDLKNVLPNEEYKLISDSDKSLKVKLKFKVVEAFQKSKNKYAKKNLKPKEANL